MPSLIIFLIAITVIVPLIAAILFKRFSNTKVKLILLFIPLFCFLVLFFKGMVLELTFFGASWILGIIIVRTNQPGKGFLGQIYKKRLFLLILIATFVINYERIYNLLPQFDYYAPKDKVGSYEHSWLDSVYRIPSFNFTDFNPPDYRVRFYHYYIYTGYRVFEFTLKKNVPMMKLYLRQNEQIQELDSFNVNKLFELRDSLNSFKIWEMKSISRRNLFDLVLSPPIFDYDGGHMEVIVSKEGKISRFSCKTSFEYDDHRYRWLDNFLIHFTDR